VVRGGKGFRSLAKEAFFVSFEGKGFGGRGGKAKVRRVCQTIRLKLS
jgi:hypothetical protein